ncbi:uncharacterized protein ARMOST_08428 [Armillaria ostoyae]|uniref:Uncharacterized protein n=1 Tax=Armillaria ostoyae TaxID=47428 RepID=A0A284R8K2_ARMOS|nr:uncharacterized protein ARMOST_08428 [Armillaria ostoyae]
MERSKVCMSAFFNDTPHNIPSLFDVSCHRRHPVLNLQLGYLRFQHSSFAIGHIRTGPFLYHLIQQSKGLKLTTEVRLIIQQVMTANGVSADVLLYVSGGPGQIDVTPEKYRDTLRAHCMDHWDWSPIVNFAHEYFTYLGLSMYTTLGPPTGYWPSGSDVDSPRFQYLEEIKEMLQRFDAVGHSDQEGMIKLNPLVYQAFAVFWDDEELTKRFATLVNNPANCLLLSHDAHKNLEEMCWAMEAIENVDRDAWDYYFVMLGGRTFPYEPADGTRIKFGAEGGRFKNDIPLPSPALCNLRLAVTKVMRLSGAAEVVESWKDEYDDSPEAICSVLGHPYTDMVALERLDEQLSSANS